MATPYLSSDRSIVDSQSSGIEIRFVDLLDRNGAVIASWGVHAPRCTIGSALDASVRVQEGNLAPNHVLLIFGKKFTLLKALAQPTRVSGRPVKEWLIDRSTTIELGELTFVVHPFQARPTSTVVRGERIPEIASRMGAEPPQVTQVAPVESHSNPATGPSNTSFPLVEPVGLSQGYETQLPAPIFLNVESTAAHHVAPEVLGQIKENMESLTAAVAALKANSVQNQLDAQATTESVVLASTQKMMEGFADRWFTDIRRELGTFGTQQQESVLALSQSLDSRLNNLEQRIETIGISSSEEMRVLADKISSLADDQCELRSSVSEMSSCQRGTILSPESVPAISSESLEFTERTRDSLPYVGDQSFSRSIESLPRLNSLPPSMERLPEADRHARMDGSDWDRKNSSDFSGQSAPYYASNLPEPELRVEQDFGESFQSAGEPEVAYEKAPHAMQWDAPVDESSDQSYVELLRRLERSQIEVERRSESLLAPELPSEVTEEPSVREPSIREPGGSNDWGSRGIEPNSNSLAQREFADPTFSDRQESGSSLSNRQTYGTPIAGDSTEEREYLRSLSVGQNLEAESVDLRQLQVGLDSDAIGNRLERLLAEASDRRKVPQATENPLERLQLYNHDVPEESSPALQPQQEIRNAKPFFAEQLLRHSTELQGDVTPGENAEDTGERELQALYASLGLVRNPGKGVDEQARPHGVSLEIAAERSRRETDADREYPSGVVGEDEIDASSLNALDEEELPPHQEQIDERAGFEEGGVQELQRPNNFEDLPELQVHNGASAVSASQRSNAANVESVEESNTEEESIEEYMQRLLQRVRSGPNSAPASDAAINRKSSLPSIPKRVTELPDRSVDFSISALSPSISEVSSASTPLSRPFTSLPLRAASRAPEAKADLDALRELANSNARRAIKRSDKRRNSTDLLVNVAVCAFSLACGLALLVMNGFRINVTFLGMTSAFLVSILWGVDSVRSYLVMLREQRNGIPTGNGSGE